MKGAKKKVYQTVNMWRQKSGCLDSTVNRSVLKPRRPEIKDYSPQKTLRKHLLNIRVKFDQVRAGITLIYGQNTSMLGN